MWVDAEDQNASLRHKNEAGALQKCPAADNYLPTFSIFGLSDF
jgi:hypothetical protein